MTVGVHRFVPPIVGAAFLAYPLLVYLMIDRLPAAVLVAVLAGLAVVRISALPRLSTRVRLAVLVGVGAFCGTAWLGAHLGLVKLYPTAISIVGLGYFAWTLAHPPSAAERIARSMNPREDFDERKIAYTRRVTQIWVGFFAFNACVSAYTGLFESTGIWAIYNGAVSYVLIGLLLSGEYVVRRRVQLRHYSEVGH